MENNVERLILRDYSLKIYMYSTTTTTTKKMSCRDMNLIRIVVFPKGDHSLFRRSKTSHYNQTFFVNQT